MRRLSLVVFLSLLAPSAGAIQLDDPINFQVLQIWSGASLGVPGRLGAMMFSADGNTIYVVGNAEATNSALYSLPVMRDPISKRVLGFGAATLLFSGAPGTSGLDTGLEIGPQNTVFYTYWDDHLIGQRTTLTSTVERLFPMAPTGVPSSVAGLAFSPHLFDAGSGFAQLQVSSWSGNGVFNVPLAPIGGGFFQPGTAEAFAFLPQQGTGAIQYIPQGRYTGNLMYVNWDFGEVRMVVIDRATGLAIDDTTGIPTLGTTNPRTIRFAYELGVGPWGLEFDPQTLDFFVSTWSGAPADSIIQFSGPGFANQAPIAFDQTVTATAGVPLSIVLTGFDADNDPLTFNVVSQPLNGTITGTTSLIVYTAAAGFEGVDRIGFRAFDGQLTSTTATVTINVRRMVVVDAGMLDSGVEDDAGVVEDAAIADSGVVIDSGGSMDADTTMDGDLPIDSGVTIDAGSMLDAGFVADSGASGRADAGSSGGDDGCSCNSTPRRSSSLGLWVLFLALLLIRRR